MARRERCSGCGINMLVSPEARVVRCSECHTLTNLVPMNARPGRTRYNGPPRMHENPYGNGPSPQHPQYPQPRPSLSPVPIYGRKRALLCGVNYHGKSYKLKGSINDVKSMKYLLVETLGFPNDSILMLTENEREPSKIPTKQNIRKALKWLVYGCQPGDSLVFHFSGHGTRQKDYNHDEVDGFDEALCPLDHETEGNIIDDEINDTIVKPLTRGTTLHAIIDACYSGTVLDLPFVCRMNKEGRYMWEDQRNPLFYKRTSGGLAFCFSACDDHQTSADTTAFTGTNVRTGAMTYSFVQAIQNERRLTYGHLLNAMRYTIGDVSKAHGASQEPQLTSSDKFDIYSKPIVL
ncbi:hypothetical protein ERO13_A01G014900v2 [Gossypium hirsutum]|uniref:Metacaspase-3 n=1 Tax=Gossypium hirsutum TaxID=3635 RepID=A0A1U8M550_GOSHI|nr:metacaspase-3 [Gossypium hirsutum]KAG4212855.1 hypothetical protein ERO13_A01G014900v2 [Gossypium hirsutum]